MVVKQRGARRVLIAGLVVLALVATACGDDDDDDGETSTATTEATAGEQPTGDAIKLELITDVSGPNKSGNLGMSEMVEAWVDHVNSNGGIAGHPVEVKVFDTGAEAPKATAEVERLIADNSVSAVLVADPNVEGVVGKPLSDAKLPVTGGVGYFPTVWGGALPYVYAISTTFPAVVNEQLISAKAKNETDVAVAVCAEVPACSAATPVFEAAVKTLGLKYQGQFSIAASATDYTAECLEIIQRKVGFLQLSGSPEVMGRLATDCDQQGFDGWYGASAGSVAPELYSRVDRVIGGLNTFPWYGDTPAIEEFRQVMEDGGVDEELYGRAHVTGVYASLELFRKTIDANEQLLEDGALSRDEVITAYGSIKDETLGGLLPMPTTFGPDGKSGPVPCFWLFTAEKGEFSGDSAATCQDEYGF
jgi:branched-chain amino acid transport system substrate-binding protein